MRRAINLAALVLLAALAVGLYKAKTEAEGDREAIARLERQLADEQESVRVMRNEIGYLESPDRLRALASEHLGLELIDPLRVVTLEEAPLLIEPASPDTPPEPAAPSLAAATPAPPPVVPAVEERTAPAPAPAPALAPAPAPDAPPSAGPRMSLDEFNAEPPR